MLHLVRASKSRPCGTWLHDDYDVFDGQQRIGRIALSHAPWSLFAPRGRPWVWSITSRFSQSPKDRGSAVSREAAMAEFKARWTQAR
jgi:hypothetical protein